MKTAKVQIIGSTPLLMHADNITWADQMEAWRTDAKNKANSKAGDDRTPAWRWIGSLYHDGDVVTVPHENIMRCLMEAGAQVPTGKGQKTFKSQTQSGLVCATFHWPLYVTTDKTVSMDAIRELTTVDSFASHVEAARDMGFDLDVRRARVGQSKHVRVRPKFDTWSTEGEITIVDPAITVDVLRTILEVAGRYKGLGDWRPGGRTPGPWGMFTVQVSG